MTSVKSKPSDGKPEEDVVDPWTVKAVDDKGVDYDKLIGKCS